MPLRLAVLGGLLWVLYGPLELLEPFGQDARYDAARGYDVIVDRGRYVLTSLPGALALLLTALAARGLLAGRASGRLATAAAVLGGLALLGVLIAFDPLFTAPRLLGTLLLGAALLVEASHDERLRALGALGIFLFPLWPLMFAVEVLPRGAGAALIALFGAGWVLLGLRRAPAPA